tara:strand:- start:338 stop:625 length:288 start_codon:yes stop_codon:yes gene_type:complete
MNRFLKLTVVILGIIIFTLLSFTIVAIFSKYKNNEISINSIISLDPSIKKNYKILNFEINKKKLYLSLMNSESNKRLIKIYNLDNGKFIREIRMD